MRHVPIIRLYSVQKSRSSEKEKIRTAEPFEDLIQKYYSVKMLS